MFEEKVIAALEKAIGLDEVNALRIQQWLEIPPDPKLGNYAFPCFRLKQWLKQDPRQIAVELAEKIILPVEIEKVEVAGPYLNFFASRKLLAVKALEKVLAEGENYGENRQGKGQRVMIEFSQPNTNKPQHVGHLRNNCLGAAVANLFEANGFKVIRTNLINDRGIHICKSMLAYQKWGDHKTPESENVKGDHFVGDYYVLYSQKAKEDQELEKQAQEMLRQWEADDKETRALWKKMNQWVIDGFNQTYADLGIKFDVVLFESQLYQGGKELIQLGLDKGIFKKKDGAVVAELEKLGLPDKVLLRQDGTALYVTQDISLAKHKFDKYDINQSIYVVASEQNLYFRQLFKILELMGFAWAKDLYHLSYGMVTLPEGKMKSREGKVVDADDLLADVKALARKELEKRYQLKEKELEKRASAIALAAIKFFMLKTDAVKDMLFKPEESVAFEGETGPYVQYSYARAKSILRKAGRENPQGDAALLVEDLEQNLIRLLADYPAIVKDAHRIKSLHQVCRFLVELAAAFNSFYHELPVLQAGDDDLKNARLALVKAVSLALKNGLSLLGIETLEEM